jgi:periplasmic protein CpxP/Spy
MTVNEAIARRRSLLIGVVLATPLVGLAAPPAGSAHDNQSAESGIDCPAHAMTGHGFGRSPGGDLAWDVLPPYLAGLTLTEEQQDRVFGILYAAAPAIREQTKALRKARQALGELTTTAQYQEMRAKALADTSAKADSQLALLRARAERDIYLLLTPEQRMRVLERRREKLAHRAWGLPTP